MSFPQYPKYKDSGVEWLGEVPEGWSIAPIKRLARLQSGDSITAELIEPEGRYTVYGGNGVRGFTDAFTHDGEYVLIGRQGALCGNVNYARGQFWASEHAVVAEPLHDYPVRWFGELLRAMNLGQYSVASAQPGLAVEVISNLRVPLPSREEKQRISIFLNGETAKIDALIEEQRRLIELLKEKRQAVISHAVTKGLDPSIPLVTSTFEWIGSIPKHWKILSAKRVARVFIPQRNKPELNQRGDGFAWVTTENVKDQTITPSPWSVSEIAVAEAGSRRLPAGSVIASCVGNFGVSAVTASVIVINQQLQAYIPSYEVLAGFLSHCIFISKVYFDQVGTAATLAYVNQQGFENLPVPLPPISEQRAIIAFLQRQHKAFTSLMNDTNLAISTLQERRSALISAAVTGKIDVRNYKPQPSAVPEEMYEPA